MKRFLGEDLPPQARIALITNDALGNYVAVTPLLQMIRSRYPSSTLHYFGGTRTQELWSEETLFDWGYPLLGSEPASALCEARKRLGEAAYDLVINLENSEWPSAFAGLVSSSQSFVAGPCVSADGRGRLPFGNDPRSLLWMDQDWMADDLTQRYPFLRSSFIGEIFCRLSYFEGPVPSYRLPCALPAGIVPDVLISAAASTEDKLWPVERWLDVVRWIERRGLSVGLLGAPKQTQNAFWKGGSEEDVLVDSSDLVDLRGKWSLPEVAGALRKCQRVVTLDNGILHMAAAMNSKTVGLFREGIHRLWAPPQESLTVLVPKPGHPVSEIEFSEVVSAIEY